MLIALGTGAGTAVLKAQNATVLATGLNAPMKLAMTPDRNLLVSESTVEFNTGRISIVDRAGVRRTLVDGLPSGPAFPGNSPLGPSALVLDGATLYVGILEGNSLIAGPAALGHPIPNPDGPASPIFSSILKLRFSADVDRILGGFTLTLDNHFTLADRGEVRLTNADGQSLTIDMLADFPDTPLDLREVWGHVTPYGMTIDPQRQFLYVADAGQNRIIQVDVNNGVWQTFVRFPRVQRSGAPETDPVPTSARFRGDQLLVTFLTGAPFTQGDAVVRSVNTTTRQTEPFINGLTTATDLLQRETSAGPQFFVSEFRSVLFGPPPTGRIVQFDSPEGKVIVDNLQGPTGMAQDPVTGEVFVTEFVAGRITRVTPQ
jgi:DNA-binding beta-propeller fold protein YncE